jgi:LysM repeat protein
LWATAVVLAAALGAGVLFRGRVAPPPSPAADEPRTVVQPTTAALAEATPEPTSPPVEAVAEPTSPPVEAVAEPTSPPADAVAEPPSVPGQAVAEPTSAAAEPVAEPTKPPAEPVAERAEPTPEPTVVAEVELPTGGQASARPAQTSPPAPPPAPPPAAPRTGTRTYTVQPRDTLKGIAARYGVSIASILAINSIPNPDSLVVGQVLVIPPR